MELEAQSQALKHEALELIETSGLLRLLEDRFGEAALVGSVDLDLMTWRDIDIYAPVERAAKDAFLALLPELGGRIEAGGYGLVRAVFNDEWLVPRGDYGSGYYWGLRVRTAERDVWKIDLWGWDPATYARKLVEHRELAKALGCCDRRLVLRLKSEAMQLPGFRDTVTSHEIYRFVLSGGGTIEELCAFCRRGDG